jgi:hypothetical protein
MDRRIYCWFTRELAAGHMALRWEMSRRFRVLTSGRMISNLPAEQLNRCPTATECPRWLKTSLPSKRPVRRVHLVAGGQGGGGTGYGPRAASELKS